MKKFKDLSKVARKADDRYFNRKAKELATGIRERLHEGLLGGYNIEGKQFKHLKKSSKYIRRKYKNNSSTMPLVDSGDLLKFAQSRNNVRAEGTDIILEDPPEYMTAQNEGFTVPPSNFANRFNTVGKEVPARNWYGIPRIYRPGGGAYNKFIDNK